MLEIEKKTDNIAKSLNLFSLNTIFKFVPTLKNVLNLKLPQTIPDFLETTSKFIFTKPSSNLSSH